MVNIETSTHGKKPAGAWFQLPALFTSHVEVLDKPDKKPKRQTKGFK